jgi:Cytochrome oxidase complex assembly protein 1
MNTAGDSGDAHLAIPLSGPKTKGTLYLRAHKSEGEWSFEKLVVRVEAPNTSINLLPGH